MGTEFDGLPMRLSEESGRVKPRGELDAETGSLLAERLRDLPEAATNLEIDLSEVTFVDCSGLTSLLAALRDARRHGRPLEIGANVSYPVRRLIELTGVEPIIWPAHEPAEAVLSS